jgi:hypothetical protein
MERLSAIIAPSLDLICTEGKSVKNIEETEGSPSFGCITSISVFGKSKKMVPRGGLIRRERVSANAASPLDAAQG